MEAQGTPGREVKRWVIYWYYQVDGVEVPGTRNLLQYFTGTSGELSINVIGCQRAHHQLRGSGPVAHGGCLASDWSRVRQYGRN